MLNRIFVGYFKYSLSYKYVGKSRFVVLSPVVAEVSLILSLTQWCFFYDIMDLVRSSFQYPVSGHLLCHKIGQAKRERERSFEEEKL